MDRHVSQSMKGVQSPRVAPRSVELSQTNHKIVNIVSSADDIFHQYLSEANDTVVLNYGRKTMPSITAPIQTYRPIAQNIVSMDRMHHLTSDSFSTSLSLPSHDSHGNTIICSQTTALKNVEPKSSPCPIKLVDMKKLLENPPDESNETIVPDKLKDNNLILNEQKIGGRKKNTPQKFTGNPNSLLQSDGKNQKFTGNPNSLLQSDGKNTNKYVNMRACDITVSHILDCLRVILPRTFDLSRLKPGDKVAGLVVKYLKLNDSRNIQNHIKLYLKIIIDAAKFEEQSYGNENTHPYHKIRYAALSAAIRRMFPAEFSVSDLSNEKLKCLCVLLSQDVFIDGFSILRKKIHEFTREGRGCHINFETKSDTPTSDKVKAGLMTDNSKMLANSSKRKKIFDAFPRENSTETNSSNTKNNNISNTNKRQKTNDSTKLVIESNTNIALNNENNTNVSLNNENNTNVSLNNENDKTSNLIEENNTNVTLNKENNKIVTLNNDNENNTTVTLNKENSTNVTSNNENSTNVTSNNENCTNVTSSNENSTNVTLNEENDNTVSKRQQSEDKKAKLTTNIKLIINFLLLNKYSAGCVLRNEKIMLNLCKYLHIRSRKSNLPKLKKMLLFIKQNDLNTDNTKMIEDAINRTIQEKNRTNDNVVMEQPAANVCQGTPYLPKEVRRNCPVKKKIENKLHLRPIVVLHDIIDYASKRLLFMGEERKYKTNRYHDLQVPVSFSQITSLEKYSSDHVRKLTNESYREFRRIVMKRDGDKVVFRLNYKRLNPGLSVFVKNFMCPSSGWLKGTISKTRGASRYIVQLDNGECWTCVPEQLRPLPENKLGVVVTYRSQRNIKPRQLFDL